MKEKNDLIPGVGTLGQISRKYRQPIMIDGPKEDDGVFYIEIKIGLMPDRQLAKDFCKLIIAYFEREMKIAVGEDNTAMTIEARQEHEESPSLARYEEKKSVVREVGKRIQKARKSRFN